MRARLPAILGTVFAVAAVTSSRGQGGIAAADSLKMPQVRRSLPVAPLQGFVANRGQWPVEVLFFGRLGDIDATIVRDGLVFRPRADPETGRWPAPLVLRFPAARSVEGEKVLPTVHHFITADGSVSNVLGFEQVVLRDVEPGIDLVVRKDISTFAYDLHVAPGAVLGDLVITVEGAQNGEIMESRALAMDTAAGRIEQRIGAAWQVDPQSGATSPVESAFRSIAASSDQLAFGFDVPGRDAASALVVDPNLVYASYVGGTGQELLADMHVDAAGAVYLSAKAGPATPTTPGAFQTVLLGSSDAWVGKLSPDGSTLEWGTYLGGSAAEEPIGCDVDQDGTIVVMGHTFSTNFPTTPSSLQPMFAGGSNDFFVSRLVADGSGLVWSTFYGGTGFEIAKSAALWPSGDVLIAGEPNSASPPATPGAYDAVFNSGDQMIVRISADGSSLVFQTYFRASNISRLVSDGQSNIYFTGYIFDQDAPLPVTPGAFKSAMAPGDGADAFAAKLNPSGQQLLWATYLGGGDNDSGIGLAVDAASAVYVVGLTSSSDFPTTAAAFAPTGNGTSAGYATKLLPGGTGLVWSTYLGACCGGTSLLSDLAVDSAGNAIAVGSSNEPNFPTTPDAFQPTYIGSFPASDAHLTKFDSFGETLVYSTYFGGGQTDYLSQVGLDAAQAPYLVVVAGSGVPMTLGAYDTSYAGGGDLAVAKFDLSPAPWQVLAGGLKGGIDTPNLAGRGAMTTGSPGRFSVRGAKPSAAATLIVGLSAANLPLKGGTLVPFPTVLITLGSNAQGALDLPFTWVNVPPGISIYSQFWIKDQQASTGFSATNALRMISQ